MGLLQYLLDRTKIDPECWQWQGMISDKGYGLGHYQGVGFRAHRTMYEILVGRIPDELELDHLCRNRACVKPDHLEPVTHQENVVRSNGPSAINAGKTHCIHGHAFSGDNLGIYANGKRYCKACKRVATARWRVKLPVDTG